jgi:hypothetical protein
MPPLSKVDSGHGVKGANIVGGHDSARSRLPEPLVYAGSLDEFTQQDLTPVIGREFEGLQVTDLLGWSDEVIRDLAITSTTPIAFRPIPGLTFSSSLTTRCRLSARPNRHSNTNERSDVAHNRGVRKRESRISTADISTTLTTTSPHRPACMFTPSPKKALN